jgi:hypothetical protein
LLENIGGIAVDGVAFVGREELVESLRAGH